MPKSISGNIAKSYAHKYSTMPSNTLAKKLFSENGKFFNSIEHARCMIRTYRGAHGDKMRKEVKGTSLMPKSEIECALPVSLSIPYLPYIVPDGLDLGIVLPDIHCPYQDNKAIEIAVKAGRDRRVKFVLYNGDTFDFYQLSKFNKDPKKVRPVEEIVLGCQLMDWVKKQLKAEEIFRNGNHEERFNNYVCQHAPMVAELLGEMSKKDQTNDYLNLPFVISQIRKYYGGMAYISDKRMIKFGMLNILHGHEYPSSFNPVNPARGLLLRAKCNSLESHFHQISRDSRNNIEQTKTASWSTGCLCELNPPYMPNNDWSHGFAIIERSGSGEFQVENYAIIGGKAYHA